MVQVDVFLSAAVGGAAAWLSRRALAQERRWWSNAPFVANAIFSVVVVAPLMLMFLARWPAWDTMYWTDGGTIPVWLAPVFGVAVVLANLACFHAVHRALVVGQGTLALALPAACLVPPAVICLAFPQRWLHVGTAKSFAAGAPFNILQSGVPWALAGVGTALGAGLAWLWRRSRN